MAAPGEQFLQLQAFIDGAFALCRAGGQGLDPVAGAGKTAPASDAAAFTQSQKVQALTETYLRELRDLHQAWLVSEDAQQAVPEKAQSPAVAQALPEPAAPCPVADAFPEKSEAPLENTSLPASLPAVPPSTAIASLIQAEAEAEAEAISLVSPPASGSQPLVAQPDGAAPVHPSLRPGQVPSVHAPLGKPAAPRISFHLPNAKAGQPYAGKLEGRDPGGNAVEILDATAPEATALAFDAPSGELRGTPLSAGDFSVQVHWRAGDLTEYTGECLMFVNPDPRSLWKQLEPPADDPYFKPNSEARLIASLDVRIAAASRRGRSHEHVGSFRDDDFFIHHDASGWSVLMVADGAGSAKHSRWGAKLAVENAGQHIADKLSGPFGTEMIQALAGWSSDMAAASQAMHAPFYRLFQEASKLAVEAIEHEAHLKDALPRDYATTLLAAIVRRDAAETFLATFWMGDGAIAAYGPRGKVRLMGSPDSGEFAGQTRFLDRTALTDPDFGKRIVLGRYADLGAVLVMTDGVSDPRFETDNALADGANWDALWDEIAPLLAGAEPQKALLEWLHFFTPGHHDDRTLAVLW